ncbi:MAG TPA: glycosyltransferase [Vampirovibrionales bacterium]
MTKTLSASIVTYKNDISLLKRTIESVLACKTVQKLYIVDNSPTQALKSFCSKSRIEYIFNNENLGFGKAHNIAITNSIQNSFKYHLVLNPDVHFGSEVLAEIYNFMEGAEDVAQLMPKVIYPNGQLQYLCKLLPSPLNLFARRFIGNSKFAQKLDEEYELRASGYNKTMNIPYLSGCFMFLRNSALKEVGLFDENIFMYIEDCDLTRRLHRKYKTLFWPEVQITHHYEKGSYKNWKLMIYNLHGAFVYFNKYGWFFDKEREKINKKVLSSVI